MFAILLLVVMLEVVLGRLAVPVLRPPIGKPLPDWHKHLDQLGLFLLHLSTALAFGVVLLRGAELALERELHSGPVGILLAAAAAVFSVLAAWSVFSPEGSMAFWRETAFVVLIVALTVTALLRPGTDPLARLGLCLLAVPFLVHYYATLELHLMPAKLAKVSNLPDRIRDLGQRSIALVALAMPLCFAPRPLRQSLLRPTPLILAGFVGTLAAVTLRKHFEVGEKIASLGLGVQLGPGIPNERMALYVAAVAAVVWVITSTLSSDSGARRTMGVGFALIVASGYSFDWPVRYLCAAAGFMAIATSVMIVGAEEAAVTGSEPPARFTSPPIPPEAWQGYVDALMIALGVTADGVRQRTHEAVEETLFSGHRRDLPFGLRILRSRQGIRSIEVIFGDVAPERADPAWTMLARPENLLATGAHPPPPASRGAVVRTGDATFDRRFKLLDEGALTPKLLDDALRARATAVLDGWLAVWPGACVHYKVCPGRGAPLDHPIPVTELAFRGSPAPGAAERMVGVLDLLADVAARAIAPTSLLADPPVG